jgi:hypothetical protein
MTFLLSPRAIRFERHRGVRQKFTKPTMVRFWVI